MNTVNPDNFNDTLKGYVKRAFSEGRMLVDGEVLTREVEEAFMRGLHWSIDLMTMEEARNLYKKE